RPDLQQAATVPLILAFFCIIGTSAPLPASRHDIYTRLLRRVLTGFWRARTGSAPDPDECLGVLRGWAWTGTEKNDPVSGVGAWTDDVSVGPGRLAEADVRAVDHVAVPLGPPNVDTGMLPRRFIHRSVREHLVAEYLAGLPVDAAAAALLPHLWFDPDWEYAAPAAIAMHPKHDQLLRDLICRAARSDKLPPDLSGIDAAWEFRELLAQVAAESREDDWSPEMANVIGDARVRLALSGRLRNLAGAVSWPASNRQVRDILLRLLTTQPGQFPPGEPVGTMIRVGATADDKRQARQVLLGLLARETRTTWAYHFVTQLVQADPAAEDKREAREILLRLLAADTGHWDASDLVKGLAELAVSTSDKRQTREILLGLLGSETNSLAASYMLCALAKLAVTEQERRHTYDLLLGMLPPGAVGYVPVLLDSLTKLAATAEEGRQASQILLGRLADPDDPTAPEDLARAVISLGPTADDMRQARQILLARLADQFTCGGVLLIVTALHHLDLEAHERLQAREALLWQLEAQVSWAFADQLVDAVVRLDPTADERRRARGPVLRLLDRETDRSSAAPLACALAQLAATADEKHDACETILRLLSHPAEHWAARDLLDALAQLAATPHDIRQARDRLLRLLLDGPTDTTMTGMVVTALLGLAPTRDEKRRAREIVLDLLAERADAPLMTALAGLDPAIGDLAASHAWAIQPTSDLLAACRRNSPLDDWLAHLPALAPLSDPALQTASRRHPLAPGKTRARTGNDDTRTRPPEARR
ncbi:MAG TPA: hypothetical protein VNF47_18055, partial [Streptosporangiaceae bacterium]|nr:hypothetical protein [Streptosporangiaceae bacterium]